MKTTCAPNAYERSPAWFCTALLCTGLPCVFIHYMLLACGICACEQSCYKTPLSPTVQDCCNPVTRSALPAFCHVLVLLMYLSSAPQPEHRRGLTMHSTCFGLSWYFPPWHLEACPWAKFTLELSLSTYAQPFHTAQDCSAGLYICCMYLSLSYCLLQPVITLHSGLATHCCLATLVLLELLFPLFGVKLPPHRACSERVLIMQGHNSKCGVANLLLSATHNHQASHCNKKLSISVLAAVHDECTQWHPVVWLWQSEPSFFVMPCPCPALPCLDLPCPARTCPAPPRPALPCPLAPPGPALPCSALPCHAVPSSAEATL